MVQIGKYEVFGSVGVILRADGIIIYNAAQYYGSRHPCHNSVAVYQCLVYATHR